MLKPAFVAPVVALFVLGAALMGQPGAPTAPRPYLGVAVAPSNDSGEGVVVREVTPDSPAAKAGLKDGDVVFKLDGKDVPDVAEFLRRVGTHKPGDKIDVQIQRDGKDKTVAATLGERPAAGGGAPLVAGDLKGLLQRPAILGVQVEPLDAEARKRLNVKAESGLVITDVVANSAAAKAGLQRDDVIITVNGQAVKDPTALREAVQKSGKELTVRVQRGPEEKELKATLRPGGIERIIPGGPGGGIRPPLDIEGLTDQAGKIRDLERRIDTLEKRLNALEKRETPKK
jgi:S1-C subfamily serine protease